MNRRTLATTVALITIFTSALTAALAGSARTSTPPDGTAGVPTVGSILSPDPVHGLVNAIAQGMYTLYENASDAA